MMGEKQFTGKLLTNSNGEELGFTIYDGNKRMSIDEVVGVLNEQQANIIKLNDEKDYWKNKAMTLLMQVRRLASRMTDAEVKEFSKELEE